MSFRRLFLFFGAAMSQHRGRAVAGPAVVFLSLFGLIEGCSQPTCTVDPRFPEEPVPAFECPSGSLCYRGACARGCTAGREGVDACEGDEDCPGSRPRCANGRCTACESGEECIPTLNICRPVAEIPLPPEPEMPEPNRPRPPAPRDGGMLDPGLVVRRDAGALQAPVSRPVTHGMFIDVFDVGALAGSGMGSDGVEVRAYQLGGQDPDVVWRLDVDPPALEMPVTSEDDCEINRLFVPTSSPTPASFGPFRIEDFDMSGALPSVAAVEATWAEGGYRLAPDPLPEPLLLLSDLSTLTSTFLTFIGAGLEGLTDGAWPDPEISLHVPFELEPEASTLELLSQVQEVGQIPTRDLLFRWVRVGTGVVATERVVVRIPGDRAELVCRQIEGPGTPGSLRVSAGLLERFRLEEAAPPGAEYPLVLERASAAQLQVDPDPANPELRLFVTARVRHGFQGRVRF